MPEHRPDDEAFSPSEIDELRPFGREREVAVGERLFDPAAPSYDFYVVIEGTIEVVGLAGEDEVAVAVHGPGHFLGELNLLTGERPLLTARVVEPGTVLVVSRDDLLHVMHVKTELSDKIFRAFVARRELWRTHEGAGTVRIIGSRYSREALALRAFATRFRIPHVWTEFEQVDDVDALLASLGVRAADIPVVRTPTAILRRATAGEFAEHLGLPFHPEPGHVFDLVIVGSGPAGLAAAVYGASEGLRTVALDSVAVGGQASASSRIENYVGFPTGISGGDLAGRAAIQAVRLGVDDLERFEGAGVYYAATDLEARLCEGSPVIVVGGGNSAGQAAIYLAQQGSDASIVVRRDGLTATMSRYLVDRIEADERITVLTQTEVRTLRGEKHLEEVTLEYTPAGEQRTVPCVGLFCFIGAPRCRTRRRSRACSQSVTSAKDR